MNSVLRACHLMEIIASEGSDVPLSKLAGRSGLARPTAHRLLTTLEIAGWIRRSQWGSYALTMTPFIVGASASGANSMRDVARPILSSLAMETGDTSYLMAPHNGKALCLDRVEGPYPVRVHNVNVGDLVPLFHGAAPLAILAFRPDLAGGMAEVEGAQKVEGGRLQVAREQGYIVSPDDLLPGITAIGAPVFDHAGLAVAGVSVAGTNDRFQSQHVRNCISSVLEAAASISVLLGHAPPPLSS